MQWNEYTIKTTTEAEDLVSNMLMELGINGVEILDNVPLSEQDKKKMFIDILPVLPEDKGIGYVKFYLEAGNIEQDEAILEKVREELIKLNQFVSIWTGTISKSVTEDTDWINNWKAFFKPFYLDDILIKPSWEHVTPSKENQIMIEIDPGTSFGTGQHETTQLCIRQLKKYMKPEDQVLDLGCGSGILSLICEKLGAGHVTGTDVDVNCMDASRDNMQKNHIETNRYLFYSGDLITDDVLKNTLKKDGYDIVVANILADIIIPMAPAVYPYLKKKGIFITSGIIDFKEESVCMALTKAGFHILEKTYQGEWVSITVGK